MDDLLQINESTCTLENAQTMLVDLNESKEHKSDIQGGLEKIIVQDTSGTRRKGYAIFTKICTWCGATVNHTHDKTEVTKPEEFCTRCRGKRFVLSDAMTGAETEAILNTKMAFKCLTCGRTYDKPTPCCTQSKLAGGGPKEMRDGYFCTGCNQIYETKVVCCSNGQMVEGRWYPASRAEYHAKSKLLLPF